MRRVIIESPLNASTRKGIECNKEYARACMRDSLSRGEAPFASHLLYDQVGILDDIKDDERRTGINAGLEWGSIADLIAIYTDNGISPGMEEGIAHYRKIGIPIEMRSLVSDPLLTKMWTIKNG